MTHRSPQEIQIKSNGLELHGALLLAETIPSSLVIFAHGSGSSRHSKRNQFVARKLADAGLSSLLFDLLTDAEEEIDTRTRHLRFDIALLAKRLMLATRWAQSQPSLSQAKIGYFGASTGAAAALVAAANLGDTIKAVVSRGGRPDLAGGDLPLVLAPTLLIVGGHDEQVISLNRTALGQLMADPARLEIVPGATHLFEEPGTLERVADLAVSWFCRYLRPPQEALGWSKTPKASKVGTINSTST
jgi:dienelactone hydrolase